MTDKGQNPKETKPKPEQEELSEEDLKLKEELEMLVERLGESDKSLYPAALEHLKNAIRTSTSSMTAVPKPLKFLRPHYDRLTEIFASWPDGENRSLLAAILSVLAMTAEGKNDVVKYRLLVHGVDDLDQWGHEYMRHLALEIGNQFRAAAASDESTSHLETLAEKIVPYFLKHQAEAEAVDLLLEVELVESLPQFVDENTFGRACLYLVSCAPFLPPPDDNVCLTTAFDIYVRYGKLPDAMALAIRLDDHTLIKTVMESTDDVRVQQQLGYLLGRQRLWLPVENEEVQECISNVHMSEHFAYLAKELNLEDPKLPQDIYKSSTESSLGLTRPDSAKQKLASVFVNAFVNCGFGKDKLVETDVEEESSIYAVQGLPALSTTASIGLLHMWDVPEGLAVLDKYLYSPEEYVKAGALLGVGVVCAGVHDETDPALALLKDYVANPSHPLQTSAIMGIGLAYTGSMRGDIVELLMPILTDANQSMEVTSFVSLALGLILIGTADPDVSASIVTVLLGRTETELSFKWSRFMALGLGLLYMGRHEETEVIFAALKVFSHPIGTVAEMFVTMCAYCGTGNVLQIQNLLRETATRPYEDEGEEEEEEEIDAAANNAAAAAPETAETNETNEPNGDAEPAEPAAEAAEPAADADTEMQDADDGDATASAHNSQAGTPRSHRGSTASADHLSAVARIESANIKAYCVLGIAVIAMGEDISQEMVMRHFDHLMHYGDAPIRRAVPLAMALVSVSNPEMKLYDTLSRYSHDSDSEVADNAVFAMGLVGSGTNNARIAQLLRQLASYYSRDPDMMFMVRIAQGLVHLGKGTLTLNPYNTERQIQSNVALGGLLTVAVALLSPKLFVLGSEARMLYFLALATQPRMLVTLNEDMEPVKVSVRVGQAVDVVGQAGKPKTITGWVTHTTPVLLGVGERAELEDDEYISLASALEGVVILKKNPDYDAAQ